MLNVNHYTFHQSSQNLTNFIYYIKYNVLHKIHLCTKFHIPNFNYSSVTAMDVKLNIHFVKVY
jgi:hypothetical protein